jgi:hypothetical protein
MVQSVRLGNGAAACGVSICVEANAVNQQHEYGYVKIFAPHLGFPGAEDRSAHADLTRISGRRKELTVRGWCNESGAEAGLLPGEEGE